MHRVPAVVAALFAFLALSAAAAEEAMPTGKLPAGVTPTHYSLELEVSSAAEGFSGVARIAVTLDAPTQAIWLHGRGLDVRDAAVQTADGRSVAATFQEIDESGIAKLEMAEAVGPGSVTLVLPYSAPYEDSLVGLYKAEGDGEVGIYTDFQPLDARRAFPGFDEPRFKTPFDIAVTIDPGEVAISNAPEQSREILDDGRQRIVFATTVPLPTYLVALAVGDFDVVEWDPIPPNAVREQPIPLRGIAPKGKGAQLSYALEHTAAQLAILEDYFASPYPYAKLDLVVPIAFGPSGMENAAAIFYRQDRFLIEDQPSIYQLRGFAILHAHELAHSWFGNLVTPAWWDDLWLNEAFATWMADKVVHLWRPEEFDDRGPLRGARRAMWYDRLESTRQIRNPIESEHDIAAAFDSITYSKGGGVLAMVERYMGPEIFREGVRTYMARHRHGVATAEEFFAALAESAGDPSLVRAFRSFVEQPGTPLLALDWACDEDGKAEVTLRQSRSLPLGSLAEIGQRWSIPICLAYPTADGRGSQCLVMDRLQTTVPLETESCPAWVLPNQAGAAYLNFKLPERGWDALIAEMEQLEPGEKLTLVGSLGAAYEAGEIGTERLLQAARIAADSPHWDVVKGPMQDLRHIKLFLVPQPLRQEVFETLRAIYQPALARFDLSDAALAREEPSNDLALLRADLIWFMAVDMEDPDLRARLSRLGQAYLRYDPETGTTGDLDRSVLHPNLVRAALIVTTQDVGLPFLEALIARLRTTNDPVLRNHLIQTIGYQTDPALTERVWQLILDPSLPGWQASQILRRQGRMADTSKVRLDWMIANYDEIVERLPRGHAAWLPWRVQGLCDRESRDRAEAFFAPHAAEHRGGPKALANVLEAIELCSAFAEAQGDDAAAAVAER